MLRHTARIHSIGRIREEGVHDKPVADIIRRRIGALHLIVDNPVVDNRILRLFNLKAPALLPEDVLVFINIRIEYSVQVDIHQILEVGVIGAGHRKHRLVRIGHRIQKGIHGSLHKLDKWIL